MIILDWSKRPKSGVAKVPPKRKIPLESMQLTLKERDSTASFVTPDLTDIEINSWIMDDTEPGKDICWRVKSIDQVYGTGSHKVTLEHSVNLLRDRIIWGEYKPADIIDAVTGTSGSTATTCTALQAIKFIFGGIEDWIFDANNFEYGNVYGAYSFDGDTLYDALETVCGTLEDSEWLMDTSKYPFTLRIRRKLNDAASEMRAGRNLRTITKTVDRSGMYTRLFPVGYDDLQLSDSRSKAAVEDVNHPERIKTYGVIEKSETNTSLDTKQTLNDWALNKLHLNNEPTVTITVEALELSDATGEPMDHFLLNRVCRVPLPEFGGQTVRERIIEINFPDKIGKPTECKLSLSNSKTELTTILASISKTTSSSTRTAARTSKSLNETKEVVLDTVKAVKVTGPEKNIYTLKYLLVRGNKDVEDDWKSGGNFSRAVFSWDVSATGGTIKITAQPQDQSKSVKVRQGTATRKVNVYTGDIEYTPLTDKGKEGTWSATGAKYTIDATERYEQGQKDVKLSGEWSGDNTGDTATYKVTKTPFPKSISSHVTLKINKNAAWVIDPAGTIRARLDNPWGTVTLNGQWSGDNTVDVATYTVTAASPHSASNSSHLTLKINRNAAWVIDPAGTIRARLDNTWGTVTLNGQWSGDNTVDVATYTVTASPHSVTNSSSLTLKINSNAAYVIDPVGTIRARVDNNFGQVTLSGQWSGDNTGDVATYTVTASPHSVTNSSYLTLKINRLAAYVIDPAGTIRARLDNDWGTVTLSGEWSGDNTSDVATYTVTAASPHSATNSSHLTLKINRNAAWVIDPAGTIRARLDNDWGTVTLSGVWSGDNTGDTATYTVTAASPHSATDSSNVKLHINRNAAWVTDPDGTIRARLGNDWGTLFITSAWTGDNTGDTATFSFSIQPHNTGGTTAIQLKINQNAAWVVDPEGTIRARVANTYSGGSVEDLGIYDSNGDAVSSRTITSALTLYGGAQVNGTWTWGSAVTITPSASRTVTFDSAGTFPSSTAPGTALAGWSPVAASNVPSSQQNMYRYIKFKVDGVQRSFYFS